MREEVAIPRYGVSTRRARSPGRAPFARPDVREIARQELHRALCREAGQHPIRGGDRTGISPRCAIEAFGNAGHTLLLCHQACERLAAYTGAGFAQILDDP
jgi:hypothetical protein